MLVYALSTGSVYFASYLGMTAMLRIAGQTGEVPYDDVGFALYYMRFLMMDTIIRICLPVISFHTLTVVFADPRRQLQGLLTNVGECCFAGIVASLLLATGIVHL